MQRIIISGGGGNERGEVGIETLTHGGWIDTGWHDLIIINGRDKGQQHEVVQRWLAVVASIRFGIRSENRQPAFIPQRAYHTQEIRLMILPKRLLSHIEDAQKYLDYKDDDEYLLGGDFTGCLVQRRSYSVVRSERNKLTSVDYNMSLRPNLLGLAGEDNV